MENRKLSLTETALNSVQRSSVHKSQKPLFYKTLSKREIFQKTEEETIVQNLNTVWKNIGKLFYKSKSKPKSLSTINVVKDKAQSLHRLSSFFRTKKLSQNSLIPVTTVGESPDGYQAAFTEKDNDFNNGKIKAMTIKLPSGITTDDVIVTVELSVINSDTRTSDIPQESMTMYCTEENKSQTVFTGILKVPTVAEMVNLLTMPLYLIDSVENVLLNPGTEINHKTVVRTSKEISEGNPFNEVEVDDVQIKLTFNKMRVSSKELSDLESNKLKDDDIGTESNKDESVERVIMVNSYNVSEISSILKGMHFTGSDNAIITETAERSKCEDYTREKATPDHKSKIETPCFKSNLENKQKCCNENITSIKNADVSKASAVVLEVGRSKKSPRKHGNVRFVSTQYSNTYFTCSKEIDVQRSLHKQSPTPSSIPDVDSLYRASSIEIEDDFSIFGDQNQPNTRPKDDHSSDTQWPSSSTTTVGATSVTLLSFPSDQGFYHTTDIEKISSTTGMVKFEDLIKSHNETLINVSPIANLDNSAGICFTALHSNKDVEKKGRTEIFSNANKMLELFEGAQLTTIKCNYKGIESYIPRIDEARKYDAHLSKNLFYFPEKELVRKDNNRRYYEDNDQFYEEHREDIQYFFQDQSLNPNHFQISKSKKNHDLYLSGDQGTRLTVDLDLQDENLEESERIITIQHDFEDKSVRDINNSLSQIHNLEIAVNYIFENVSKTPLSLTNDKQDASDSTKEDCASKAECNREFDSKETVCTNSSSSIVFQVEGGMKLKTEDSCNLSFSKKTMVLEETHVSTIIDLNKNINKVISNIEETESKLLEECNRFQKNQNKNRILSSSDHVSIGHSSKALLNKRNEEQNLEKSHTKPKNKETYMPIVYSLISERYLTIHKFPTKLIPMKTTIALKHPGHRLKNKINAEDKTGSHKSVHDNIILKDISIDKVVKKDGAANNKYLETNLLKQVNNLKDPNFLLNDDILQLSTSTSQHLRSIQTLPKSEVTVEINSLSSLTNLSFEQRNKVISSKVSFLKDCLVKMNEILLTATSMSLLNSKGSNVHQTQDHNANSRDADAPGTTNVNVSQERQETYEAVENDIKKVIKELLKESNEIKENVILKGEIEESGPPFIVDYINQEPIDYEDLCLVMLDEIKKHEDKNDVVNIHTRQESELEAINIIDNIIDAVVTSYDYNSHLTAVELVSDSTPDTSDQIVNNDGCNSHVTDKEQVSHSICKTSESSSNIECNKEICKKNFPNASNSFERRHNSINTQMSYFFNSDVFSSKIPKTCFSFGKVIDEANLFNVYRISNTIRPQGNENKSYSNNEFVNSFNNIFNNTHLKSENSFSVLSNEPVDSRILPPSINPGDDNDQIFLKVTSWTTLNDKEALNKNDNVTKSNSKLNKNTEDQDVPKPSTKLSKGILKSKKSFQLPKLQDTKMLSTSSLQPACVDGTTEEELLKNIDLTSPKIFITEEEEEVLFGPKPQILSPKTCLKDLFTNSSSDDEIYVTQIKPMQKTNTSRISNSDSRTTLQPKASIPNLYNEFKAEVPGSHDSIPNLKILNAKHSSNASDADDENEKININLPKHRYKSKLELNTPQEVADIEKNLEDNDVLRKIDKKSNTAISFDKIMSFKVLTISSSSSHTNTESSINEVKDMISQKSPEARKLLI